jgi:hypothetical protein
LRLYFAVESSGANPTLALLHQLHNTPASFFDFVGSLPSTVRLSVAKSVTMRSTSPLPLVAIATVLGFVHGKLSHLGPGNSNKSAQSILVLQRLGMLLHGVQPFLGVLKMRFEETTNAIAETLVREVGFVKNISIVICGLTDAPHEVIVERLDGRQGVEYDERVT